MNYVVDIVPQVVIFTNVTHKTSLCVFVERESFVITNEAYVGFVFFHKLFLFTQLSKSVDDNTSQYVCHCNFYDDKEGNVDSPLNPILLQVLTVVELQSYISNTSTLQKTVSYVAHVAVYHSFARTFTYLI